MTSWITEAELKASGGELIGLTLNTAFLEEIKQDHVAFRQLMQEISGDLSSQVPPPSRRIAEKLGLLRDHCESYFALEEFYGYFQSAKVKNQAVSASAESLRDQHQSLFLQLNEIVELSEQVAYKECNAKTGLAKLRESYADFFKAMQAHEENEMQLVMRLHNEVLGVGD